MTQMPLIRHVPSFPGALRHFAESRGSTTYSVVRRLYPDGPDPEEPGDDPDEDSEIEVDVDEDGEDDDDDMLDPEFDDEELPDEDVVPPIVPRGPR